MSKIKIEVNRGDEWVVKAELEQHGLQTREQIAEYLFLYSERHAHRAYVDDKLVAICQPGQPPELVDDFVYEGSLAPRLPKPVRTFLVYGPDVPPKMVFANPNFNEILLPYMVNGKKADGPYQYLDEVVGGFFKMHETPYQAGDQTHLDGNETIRQGTKEPKEDEKEIANTVLLARENKPPYGSAWLIRTELESFILVIPECPDSFEVADTISDQITGRFSVNAFMGGQLTIGEPVPGWNMLLVEKEDENMSMSMVH